MKTMATATGLLVFVCLRLWSPAHGQTTFRAGVAVVAVYVTVVGQDDILVPTLLERDFELQVDGKRQQIAVFKAGALPITIAVLLDNSPSMQSSKPSTLAAGSAFVRRLRSGDRATVGVFSRTVTMHGDLTGDQEELMKRLRTPCPVMAGTALWDAISAGMASLEDEAERRVVLVMTDGDDNTSETTANAVAERAMHEGVLVYAIGIRGAEGRLSKGLKDLARESGGVFCELKSTESTALAFQRVADELHAQYLIGFSPGVLDGKAHRLEVKVRRSGLSIRARRTFIASPADPSAPQFVR